MALINSYINTPRAGDQLFSNAANQALPEFKPVTNQVVDTNSTVSGQLNGLISSNSPYIQAARSSAMRQANSRGLQNSSIAAGAGELAAIQSALPIAQQDAQSFFNASQFNANSANTQARDFNQLQTQAYIQGKDAAFANAAAENQFARSMDLQQGQQAFQGEQAALDRGQQLSVLDRQQTFQGTQAGLDRQQQTALQNSQQQFQGTQAAADRALTADQNQRQRETQLALQNIDANTRVQLANIEADYKQVLQSSANASSIFSEFSKNIGAIQTNTSLNAESKTKLVQEQISLMRNAFDIQGKLANLDLSALIPQVGNSTAPAATTPAATSTDPLAALNTPQGNSLIARIIRDLQAQQAAQNQG